MARHSDSNAGRFSWPIALTVIVLIIAAVVLTIFIRLETWPARTARQGSGELERIARQMRETLIDIGRLQPRITINNRVYTEQTLRASELVVVSRRVDVEHEFTHTWAGSSKRVKLHGTFQVKAGFDLRQSLTVDIRPDEIVIQLPHGQILGIEQEQVEVLAFENGFWNRISGADVESQLATLPQLAREKANATDLSGEAERALQQQLDERILTPQPLRVRFGMPPAPK